MEWVGASIININFLLKNHAFLKSKVSMGLLRGYGVFDFIRTYGGKPFYLDGHVKRLIRSATLIGLTVPWTMQEIIDITMETLRR